MSVLCQMGCTLIVCCTCLCVGLMNAWPSSTLQLFLSANTTLHRPMEETEVALFGSLSSIGALISTPLSGFLLDRLGRKYCCILFSLPQVVAWVIICISSRVEAILTAIFLSGLSGSLFLLTPVFITEFCQESIRGMLASGSLIGYGIGLLISYLVGGCLEYATMNYVFLSVSTLAVVMLCGLKESPLLLMKKGLNEEAAKSIAFYRRVRVDSKEVTQEMNIIRRALDASLEDASPEEEKLKPETDVRPMSKWQFLKKSQSTRRALFVSLFLYTASIFQGLIVVQVYAEPLFTEAMPNVPATLCCVLLAVTTVAASCVAAYLIDKAGRRPLMIYSSACTGVCCVILGSQIHLHWGSHWITGVFIYAFCITYTIGAGTVPFVLVAEVFLPEIKSLVTMISVEWGWTCNFVILFIFRPLVNAMGLGPVFYLFAGVAFASVVFCVFYLPETKGLTVDVIQSKFFKRKRVPEMSF